MSKTAAKEEKQNAVKPSNLNYSFKFNEIKWRNVILIVSFHIVAIYAKYLYVIGEIKWQNALFAWVFGAMSALGVTIGAHRLWSHRSFKAKWPLRCVFYFAISKTNFYQQTYACILGYLCSRDGHLQLVS